MDQMVLTYRLEKVGPYLINGGEVVVLEALLREAHLAHPLQQLVGLDEEPRRQQEGEEVGRVGVVHGGGHGVLHQRLQRPRHQHAVLVHQRLCEGRAAVSGA